MVQSTWEQYSSRAVNTHAQNPGSVRREQDILPTPVLVPPPQSNENQQRKIYLSVNNITGTLTTMLFVGEEGLPETPLWWKVDGERPDGGRGGGPIPDC